MISNNQQDRPGRSILASIRADFTVQVEVAADATDEQVAAAVIAACPKYPDVKAGVNFDPADFRVLDDSADSQAPAGPVAGANRSTCTHCGTPIVLEREDDPWFHDETGEERCEGTDEFANPGR